MFLWALTDKKRRKKKETPAFAWCSTFSYAVSGLPRILVHVGSLFTTLTMDHTSSSQKETLGRKCEQWVKELGPDWMRLDKQNRRHLPPKADTAGRIGTAAFELPSRNIERPRFKSAPLFFPFIFLFVNMALQPFLTHHTVLKSVPYCRAIYKHLHRLKINLFTDLTSCWCHTC